jgi:CubicO group peptidase (beta-lactamase class C family)
VQDPDLMRYRATEGINPTLTAAKSIKDSYTFPLLFEPGESWEYGVGIDWAAWAVERVTKMSVPDYMEKHIWGPLGINSMSFHPKTKPACMEKLTDMSERSGGVHPLFGVPADPEGKVAYTDNRVWGLEPDGVASGAGGFGAPLDYQKILQSICANDEQLLKRSTVEEMFKPQLSEASCKTWMALLAIPEVNQTFGGFPAGMQADWGLGGCLIMEDLSGAVKKGTMTWGGYPNLQWFCDRKAGLSGILGCQTSIPGDLKVIRLYQEWQKELYKRHGKEKL